MCRDILASFLILISAWLTGNAVLASEPGGDETPPVELELTTLLGRTGDTDARVQRIQGVLADLRLGTVDTLRSLPPEFMLMPLGVPDEHQPGLTRRWSAVLSQRIAEQTEATRGRCTAILDDDLRGMVSNRPQAEILADSAVFLPALLARDTLGTAAALAFDHGRFRYSLAIDALLSAALPLTEGQQRRDAQALLMTEVSSQVEPDLRLSAPGLPVPVQTDPLPAAAARVDMAPGIAVTWSRGPLSLQGRDPLGHIWWQRSVLAEADIRSGPGAALIQEHDRLRVVREDGSEAVAAPLPDHAIAYPICGGSGWFLSGSTVLRVDLASAVTIKIRLPDVPVIEPLVRGQSSWWLTRTMLLRCSADRVDARMELGFTTDAGWRWSCTGDDVFLVSPAGDVRRIPSFDEEFSHDDAIERAHLLNHALRFVETLILAQEHPAVTATPAGSHEVMLAILAQPTLPSSYRSLMALAKTPQDQVFATYARWLDTESAGADSHSIEQALGEVVRSNPQVILPRQRTLLCDDPATWVHRISGAALAKWLAAGPGRWPPDVDGRHPVQVDSLPAGVMPLSRSVIKLGDAARATDITCVAAGSHALLWQNSWPTPPVQSAPQHSHVMRDGYLLVSEGATRLEVIDAQLGDRLGTIDFTSTDAEPAQSTVLGLDANGIMRVAMSTPLGINTSVVLAGSDGHEVTVTLPCSARWLVRAPHQQVLASLSDGSALLIDDHGVAHRGVALPPTLGEGPRPIASPRGLSCNGRTYPWRLAP